jgi:hypothetical protein
MIRFGCGRIYIFFHRNLPENIHLLPPKSAREYTSSSTEICQRIYIFFHRNLLENIHLFPYTIYTHFYHIQYPNLLLPHTISKLTSTTYNIQTYFYHIQHPNLLLPHATSKLTPTTIPKVKLFTSSYYRRIPSKRVINYHFTILDWYNFLRNST